MHTPSSLVPYRSLPAVVALVLLWIATGAVRSQPSFPGAGQDVNANVRVYPLDVWSPRVGPGGAAGLVVNNLGRQHAQWLVTAAPALHEQVGTFSFASANPRRAEQYVLYDAWARHTDRRWFYGLGPGSKEASRLAFDQTTLRARLRAGQSLLNGHLHLQPRVKLQYHRLSDIGSDLSLLRPRSQDHLNRLRPDATPGDEQLGLRVGTAVQLDTRNDLLKPTQGVLLQVEWDHYVALDDSGVDFDQVDINASGFVPFGGAHRLAVQGRLALTVSQGSVPVPFYQLPTLDGSLVPGWNRSRFVGADRLLSSVLYRFPLIDASGLLQLEGHVGLHAASVYDDIGNQFEASLSFEDPLSETDATYPLRPAASAGLHFGVPLRERTVVELAVGLSPEGVSGVRFTFSTDILTSRSPHHSSRALR